MDDRAFEAEMAHGFYGYGRWDAPHWFIGPEQGIGPKGVGNAVRSKVWHKLGSPELCDCKEFHFEIGEDSWYRTTPPPAPLLQSTWRPLMLLLMSFLGERPDQDNVML